MNLKRLVVLLMAALTLIGSASAASASLEPAVIRIALEQDIETIDPQQNTAAYTCAVTEGVTEPLLREHGTEILPGLAESYETSDYQTWIFNIRKDAQWSDGTPITARDIEWSYKEIFTRPEAAKVYILFSDVSGYKAITDAQSANATEDELRAVVEENFGVTALDDYTLEVKLASPRPYVINTFASTAWAPIKKDLYEQYGNAYGSAADKTGYNGAYVVSEWRYNESVALEPNPNYWNAANIKIDRVELLIVKDQEPRVNMFREGKVDSARASSEYLEMMADDAFVLEGTNWNYVLVNSYRRNAEGALVNEAMSTLLANRDFVNAINAAINRTTLFGSIITDPSYLPTNYVIPSIINSNNVARDTVGKLRGDTYADLVPITRDEAKAKEYLAKALETLGYASVDQLPKITIVCASTTDPQTVGEYMKNALEQTLGLKIDVEPVEFNVRDSRIISGDYDLLYMGWGVSNNDADGYLSVWSDDLFCTGWPQSDPETYGKYADLITFIGTTADMDARANAILEAEQILLSQGPIITLATHGDAILLSKRFDGFGIKGTNSLYDYNYASPKN
ncbi:MAG: peptide ABC transporter substrate-binding protein [Oscillospiraceae bacterium]|jgi:oligopeptide transport system substrate-binding protein|nr:peptide ABC transporter substrate-binding protein [Oscillospiraceae bacterium]